jgi:phage replisome organizer, putative, N-terminal region
VAEVKWIKVTTDIFDDEKILLIESMPDADSIIVIWFKLLCLAGKQNNHGVFMINDKIPYTEEMFATIFRRNINTVRLALKTFEQFDMIEIYNDTVIIPKWEKHQSLDALEKSREATRNRVKKWREQQKLLTCNGDGNVTCNVTDTVTDNVTETDGNGDRIRIEKENKNKNNNISPNAEAFERIWKQYPRREGRKDALAAFEKAIKKGTTIEQIESGIQAYCEHIKKCNIERQYIKQGSTYFRGEHWNDVYDDSATTTAEPKKKTSYDLSKVIPAIPVNR